MDLRHPPRPTEARRLRRPRQLAALARSAVWLTAVAQVARHHRVALRSGPAALAAWLFAPRAASAHIKWFAPYDVAQPPKAVASVLDGRFDLVFAAFTLLLVASFLLDRVAWARAPRIGRPGGLDEVEDRLLRAGVGGYFMALFATGGALLTPELHTDATWPGWLQLGIAASMLTVPTGVFGSLGILVLYACGVWEYGAFHLCDYPLFLGLAAFVALLASPSARWRARRLPILQASFCISLMWGAVEKWAYPQWTLPLLEQRPYLTLGLSPSTFMVLAGFVEFAFAFFILTGRSLLRLAVLGLLAIFTAAIFDFGKPDAIGHLPFLVTMVVLLLHGPTQWQTVLHERCNSVRRLGQAGGAAFAATLLLFLGTYYGLQKAEYRPPGGAGDAGGRRRGGHRNRGPRCIRGAAPVFVKHLLTTTQNNLDLI